MNMTEQTTSPVIKKEGIKKAGTPEKNFKGKEYKERRK